MPNLDPWINQNQDIATKTITNKFENHLLSIRDELQQMIHPKSHPTYNERHQKITELIDCVLQKYRDNMKKTKQDEQIIINNIINELSKKRDIAIHKKTQALFKDEVAIYRLEEATIDYVLFKLREFTGKFYH